MTHCTPAYQQQWRAHRRAQGLCVACPRPSLNFSRCLKCRQHVEARVKLRMAKAVLRPSHDSQVGGAVRKDVAL